MNFGLNSLTYPFTNYMHTIDNRFCVKILPETFHRFPSMSRSEVVEFLTPKKATPGSAGYDIHLIRKHKTVEDVYFFGTGISVQPPDGYYIDMVPRSSISKTGYMLTNSVGVIDADYRGEILVALRKIDPDTELLKLPSKMVQLILRPLVHFDPVVFDCDEINLDDTERGSGGFGSTDA